MSTKHLLLFLLIFSISFAILPQDSDWKIPYSKYRLIYSIDINSTVYASPLIEITIQIPHSYIDDMLQYYEAHNYTMNASMWPVRLYYFNQTSGEQTQISCRKALSGSSSYPYCSWNHTYRGVPDELNVVTKNDTIVVGTNYYIVYMPLFYWDDGEYVGGTTFGWVGASISDSGINPTPEHGVYLKINVVSSGGPFSKTAYKLVDIPISSKQVISKFMVQYGADNYGESSVSFYLTGKDNNQYKVSYSIFSGDGSGTVVKEVDLLEDACAKYSAPVDFFTKVSKVELYVYHTWSGSTSIILDNLMIIPSDINNQ